MSLDLLDGPLEAWESRGAPIPPHLPHSHTRKPSRHGRHRHAAPAPAPVPHSVQGTPRGLSPSPTPAHSTPRGPQSVSRLGLQCAMTSRDELTREILLGCLDATPRRERAELGTLVRDGIVGDVLSEVYPCLVPAPLPEPTPNHPLSGVLGPDVTVVPAFGRPNVVILLPCVSHARALGEGDVQDVGLAGAVCVAVDAIASPADIRVFGEPATRVPFFVRCVCGSDPCERELPENWAVTGCDIDAPGLEYTSRLPTSTLLHSSRFGPDAGAKEGVCLRCALCLCVCLRCECVCVCGVCVSLSVCQCCLARAWCGLPGPHCSVHACVCTSLCAHPNTHRGTRAPDVPPPHSHTRI